MWNWKYLLVSIAIVGCGTLGYLSWTNQLPSWFSGRYLLSQVTSVNQIDLQYLQGVKNLEQVKSTEDLLQRLIQTLLLNSQQFDASKQTSVEDFLKKYYEFPAPIPTSVSSAITTASQKYIEALPILAKSTSTTVTPFLNQVINVLAEHQSSSNNHQSVRRARTGKNLLDSLVKQL